MRLLFALVCLFFLGTFAWPSMQRREEPPAQTFLTFERVQPNRSDAGAARVGALHLLEAWNIESNDFRFGGLSALQVEGGEATALSDAGTVVRFTLPAGEGTVRAALAPLRDGPGDPGVKSNRDVESIVVHGPFAWLGLERANAVWRYDRQSWTSSASAQPPEMERWKVNRGAEAMVRLPDGRFIVFSEGSGGISPALMFLGDPAVPGTQAVPMRYRPPEGYRITDAALLPDGRLLYLNRRIRFPFEGMTAKLAVGPIPEAREDGIIEGREIAHLRRPWAVDNMEGLSVTREGARTILWIVSDDNFNAVQRTLLLKAALEEAP
jgi:hypothetical protein